MHVIIDGECRAWWGRRVSLAGGLCLAAALTGHAGPAALAGLGVLASPSGVAAQPGHGCPAASAPAELDGVPACLEEVGWTSGTLRLAGQWFTPRRTGPEAALPTVVFLRGSGDSRRGNPWTLSVAAVALEEGFGVLVPDKRGSGRSEGDWRHVGFEALAEDALAAVRFLAERPEVDPRRIGLMGLSQGGQVAPVAAARSERVAFVVNVVGAAVPLLQNVRYEMVHAFREAGLEGSRLRAAEGMLEVAVGHVLGEIGWEDYEATLDSARAVLGPEATEAFFLDDPEHWRWAFFQRLADFDPVEHWRGVDRPVLVLYGGADANTPSEASAARLRRLFRKTGHPDWTVRVFPGLGHNLWDTSGPMERHGLHPRVRSTLAAWLRRVGGPGGGAG